MGKRGPKIKLSVSYEDSARYRQAIKPMAIIERLQAHVQGGTQMTVTQIRAAEILLRKCLPDLIATTITGQVDIQRQSALLPRLEELTRARLEAINTHVLAPRAEDEGEVAEPSTTEESTH